MKHIFVNLKRFELPPEYGGINRIAPVEQWAKTIMEAVRADLRLYSGEDVEFAFFFPESHILQAVGTLEKEIDVIKIGCQGVYREDVRPGENFGAFTGNHTAMSMKLMGCDIALIGHCEERKDKMGILKEAGVDNTGAVNRILNKEVKAAQDAGLRILYCIGENADEMERWQKVLSEQLDIGLKGADLTRVVIGYEPIWSIGPGKKPADEDYIQKVARFVKDHLGNVDIVYGGGLKRENAAMMASIEDLDGGLIGLTRFSGNFGFYTDEYLEIVRIYMDSLPK